METERLEKEAQARGHRLADMLSRLSHNELLTALSLLGVALNRDQALFLSKRVAVKLSVLGFGKPSSKADTASASPPAASAAEAASSSGHPMSPSQELGDNGKDAVRGGPPSRSVTPLMQHSHSPPPPPPPPPPATDSGGTLEKGTGGSSSDTASNVVQGGGGRREPSSRR